MNEAMIEMVQESDGNPRKLDFRRAQEVLHRVKELKQIIEKSYIEFSELLAETAERRYYLKMGFDTFEQYAEDELHVKRGKAWALIRVWRNLVEEAHVSPERLRSVGWSMAAQVASLPKDELKDGKVEGWLEKAKTRSQLELAAEVRKAKNACKKGGEMDRFEEVFVKEEVLLDESQVRNVRLAIETARKIAEKMNQAVTKITKGFLWDLIALEFNASRCEKYSVKLNWILGEIERVFGVQCVAVEDRGGKEVVLFGGDTLRKYLKEEEGNE